MIDTVENEREIVMPCCKKKAEGKTCKAKAEEKPAKKAPAKKAAPKKAK